MTTESIVPPGPTPLDRFNDHKPFQRHSQRGSVCCDTVSSKVVASGDTVIHSLDGHTPVGGSRRHGDGRGGRSWTIRRSLLIVSVRINRLPGSVRTVISDPQDLTTAWQCEMFALEVESSEIIDNVKVKIQDK